MTDNTRVSGSVTVDSDSRERVAFDLMHRISIHEVVDAKAPRRYWLDLYRQSLSIVKGHAMPEQITERPK